MALAFVTDVAFYAVAVPAVFVRIAASGLLLTGAKLLWDALAR